MQQAPYLKGQKVQIITKIFQLVLRGFHVLCSVLDVGYVNFPSIIYLISLINKFWTIFICETQQSPLLFDALATSYQGNTRSMRNMKRDLRHLW